MIRKKWFGWGLLILLALGIIVFWMGGVLKTSLVEVEKKQVVSWKEWLRWRLARSRS